MVWFVNLRSYRLLNGAKYLVILGIEERLPYAGYKEEDEKLKRGSGRAGYTRLTVVESYVPVLMLILFAFLGAYSIYELLCG